MSATWWSAPTETDHHREVWRIRDQAVFLFFFSTGSSESYKDELIRFGEILPLSRRRSRALYRQGGEEFLSMLCPRVAPASDIDGGARAGPFSP